MNNTKRNRAIAKMEAAATALLSRAELVAIQKSEWSKRGQHEQLLEEARAYAKAVDSLAKMPS
jgi:hypothetical protein